jgi:hypothetical protein
VKFWHKEEVRFTVLTRVCVMSSVLGLVVIVASFVTVDNLVEVFVGVVVNFLVVVVWFLGSDYVGWNDFG